MTVYLYCHNQKSDRRWDTRALLPYKDKIHTITADNGKEFARHKEIAKGLDAEFYFAHPYHSWERGANENTNGLIRQYIPKGTDFSELTDEMLAEIEWKLNHRPRSPPLLGGNGVTDALTIVRE